MHPEDIDDTALAENTLPLPNVAPSVRDEVLFGLSADEHGVLTINAVDLLANDSDADGHHLSVVAVDGAELLDGTVRLPAPHDQHDGSVRSFTYTVADELGALSSATAWVIVEDQSSGHHQDGAGQMHADHMAALDLATHADATHFAVRTGAWSDPTTWLNGDIPDDDDRAVILEGVDVLYDVASDASLFTVRVDGQLRFDHTKSTRLEVDTLLVGVQGSLIIGDKDNPIEDGVTADIVFANNGDIDVEWDPMLLSRGLVSLGKVEIHGEEVQPHAKVSADPLAGANSIEFADTPTGWKVGDTIVIAGTNYDGYKWDNSIRSKRHYEPEDEVRTITAIDGNAVYFDEPLEYDHSAPREDLKTSVANYSRSVTFQTEGGETAANHERGHVMFMQSNDVDARYAAFDHLGRTDKSISSASVASFEDVEATTNVQGRYSLHLHQLGTDGEAVDLVGNAVFGSPGWGIVNHDSNAVLDGNATYDTYGAGFVAETGNETGVWSNNIAIYAQGRSWAAAKNINSGDGLDIGKSGDGFWFRGRAVDAIDNIAASVNNGFIYYHRGGGTIPVEAESYQLSELLLPLSDSDGRLSVDKPALLGFDGNEVFASNNGFHVVKANPKQSHDVNSVISNFSAWSVRTGIDVEYSSEYIFRDVDLVGREPGLFVKAEAGVDFGRNVYGINLNNVKIDGFKYGAKLGAGFTSSQFDREELPYHLVDVEISNAQQEFLGLREDIDVVISGEDLNTDPIEINIDQNLVYERVNGGNYYLRIKGSKVDSLGETQIVDDFDKFALKEFHVTKILEEDGYYTNDDGLNVFFFKSYHSDRGTGEIFKAYTPIIIGEDVPLGKGAYADAIYRGHVSSENQNPVGNNDNYVLDGENEIVIDVLANDSDPEGGTLSVDGFLQPHHGFVDLNDNGELIYRPSALGPQNDKFKYWLTDGEGGVAEAWAHITIAPPNVPPVEADILLALDTLETGSFGNNFDGQTDADGAVTASFTGTDVDFRLTFQGYDVDYADEIELFLNGSSIGFLDAGVNEGFASYSIDIAAADQVSGPNIITFDQAQNDAFKWGVTDLLLSEASAPPPPPVEADILLALDTLETGSFGNNFDGQTDADGAVTASFTGTDVDLRLTFRGYDVDYANEIELFLNGSSIGFLDAGVNEGFASYTIDIAAAGQVSGPNIITFDQAQNDAFKWGVTDLLLSEASAPPPPPVEADILLALDTLETGSFGNNFNGQTDADGAVTASFTGTDVDLRLTFRGYDVDYANEIELFLNGSSIGFLDAGVNEGFASYTIDIAAADQVSGPNIITFDQAQNDAFKWGVTDLLLSEASAPPPPPVEADILLALDTLETGSFGNNFDGQTDADGAVTASFTGTDVDLRLTFRGYDVDYANEIELFLNGSSIGFLDAGVNEGFASYTIDIAAADQVSGPNIITFDQAQNDAFKWGVTDLLLSEASAPPPPPVEADILLALDTLETGSFGNNFNGQTDADGAVTASFTGTDVDLRLTFRGYDVDYADEIELFLNGSSIGFLDAGVNEGFASYTIDIAAADQVSGPNIITFDQAQNDAFKWGVTDLLLSEASPPPPPPAVTSLLVNGVETSAPVSYGATQDVGEAVVSEGGSSVSLTDNAWKSIAIDQAITADTLLSFEFKADVLGEIHGIGFDTDDAISEGQTFQLAGSQVWGIQGENGGYDVGDGWQQFDIRVGDYFTGNFDRLVFAMDDDAGVGANSAFRNVEIMDATDQFLF